MRAGWDQRVGPWHLNLGQDILKLQLGSKIHSGANAVKKGRSNVS
jgi:hypothetical protein